MVIYFHYQRSGNGTFINNKRLSPHTPVELDDRDIIEIGRNPQDGNSGYKFVFYKKANFKVSNT